ncbi:MAG: F0F1 ATP synthase subunit gamma [Pseudomonadota bacterium]
MVETTQALARRIDTTHELRSIVRTMKALAAVSIRQYEQAVVALDDYRRTVDLALRAALGPAAMPETLTAPGDGKVLTVVFGSDYGLCGRFNQEVVHFAKEEFDRRRIAFDDVVHLAVGIRAAARLDAAGARLVRSFVLPGSVDGLTRLAEDLLLEIDRERRQRPIGRILLVHNHNAPGTTAAPMAAQLLPLDPVWLAELRARPWPSRRLPSHTMDRSDLLRALVRQHLFLGLFRAAARSAASEHATRLAAMQAAERNIDEHLDEMTGAYRRQRQAAITSELLDVVSGFEALTAAEPS